jgi:spermidine synthase
METSLIYFKSGRVVAESGDVKAFSMNNELFLEIGPGRNLWALEREVEQYVEQLWDKPKGKCLEIGLGLGIASRCILSYPGVTSLTTVERSSDVINVHEQLGTILDTKEKKHKWSKYIPEKHLILNCEGLEYVCTTKMIYDFIFLDFWSCIDEESLCQIADMANAAKRILKPGGKMVGWFDNQTPTEFVESFNKIFK